MKPRITRSFAAKELWVLGVRDCWRIDFAPSGNDFVNPKTGEQMGIAWFAGTCEYVRSSIAAWYRDGAAGLSALHEQRYGAAK